MEIYKIQNKINKKVYIGLSTQGWKVRINHHKSEARRGCDYKLHRAIRKYGVENFKFNLLESCESNEELIGREIFWIDALKATDDEFGYNMTKGGDGTLGRMHSEETKKLQSEAGLNCSSNRHLPIQATNTFTGEMLLFKSNRSASKFLDIPEQTLYNHLLKGGGKCSEEAWDIIKRDDLKPIPKARMTKRDPEQVKQHMLNMQAASSEARKDDNEWKEKSYKTTIFGW